MKPLPVIELRSAPFGTTFWFYRSANQDMDGYTAYVLKLGVDVPDARTGEPGGFGREDRIYVKHGNRVTRKKVATWAREMLHGWLCHEADEWLHVDGVRVFDPHP